MNHSTVKMPTDDIPRFGRHYISELQIQLRCLQLAQEIAGDYGGKSLMVIAVLKGAFMFAADLVRRLWKHDLNPELDFIRASSYGSGTVPQGEVRIHFDVERDLSNMDVLLVDDIIDTGETIRCVHEYLASKNPKSLRTCVLLNKPARRKVEFQPEYVGFEIPNFFVVGYGLDFNEKYRCLPYLTRLNEDEFIS